MKDGTYSSAHSYHGARWGWVLNADLPLGKNSGIHCTGGSRAGLDGYGKEEFSRLFADSNPDESSPQRDAITTVPSQTCLMLHTLYIYYIIHTYVYVT
jgi:hypothetical protein